MLGVSFQSFSTKREEIELNRCFDRFVVYSDYSRLELLRNGFDFSKISVHVPMRTRTAGEDLSAFGPGNRIVFAGQIIRGKGLDVLLRALTKVRADFECVVLGDGNHRRYCESLSAKLGLASRVHFEGYVPQADFRSYFLTASVFAMPSVWPEPFGMAGPEAMLYGLPVVAFNVGGVSEWLIDGENGFLVPWMDTTAFAARIDQLLSDKSCARHMGLRGFQRVSFEYEAATQVDKLEAELLSLSNELADAGRTTNRTTAAFAQPLSL